MNTLQENKLRLIGIFFILGIFMISSPSLRIYAADEQGSSGSGGDSGGGGDSGDSGGGDSGSKDDSGGGSEDKQESSDNNEESNDSPKEDKQEVKEADDNGMVSQEPNRGDLKGTPEEQEKAAVEDYVNEEPGIKKPYPPVTDKPKWGTGNEIPKCHGPDGCGGFTGKPIVKEPFNCKDGKWTKGCVQIHPNPYKGKGDGKGGDGWKGKEHDYDGKHENDHDHNEHDHHGHDNDWCKHHNCHEHHHHSSTHTSDNHEGDVTVKIDLKYSEESSKKLNDMILFIGDDYDKNLDLSDKPDTIKVNHLDIDGGDTFAVCLANEDTSNGDCVVEEANSDHDTVNTVLTVR